MNKDWEERILIAAVEQGLLSDHQLEELDSEARTTGSDRIELLRGKHWLDDRTLVTLCSQSSGSAYQEGDFLKFCNQRSKESFSESSYGRFEQLQFLGQGGMALVYKAYDPMLGREVALKFLRIEDHQFERRLIHEAQAQAQIDHENVCKIFEAGQIEGRAFIAMQYIAGETLKTAGKQMNLEEKIRLMVKVCDAVHAAHRAGLIHRDLKPANILVEKNKEGDFVPYVLDFGLARLIGDVGVTHTGAVLGSPLYMSPEQARGQIRQLDRRSDVFSLGITLYELLTGELPFPVGSSIDSLIHLMESDPVPLRNRDPGFSADLETIVMKCLEKEPARRYDSARLLAGDLDRYLNGEPILAKPSGIVYRLGKKAKKHKISVTLGLLTLLSALFVLGFWIHTKRTSVERARVAQEFGRQIEKMDSVMRIAHLIPLHNTGGERAVIQRSITQILNQIPALGPVAEGPGYYAAGRGYMALGKNIEARRYLELAWEKDYREPDVAHALGLTLGKIYQKELQQARRIPNQATRKAFLEKIRRNTRDLAVSYLRASKPKPLESHQYVEGLVAFYQEDYQGAFEKAQKIVHKVPWFYEARILSGDAQLALAGDRVRKGDYQSAYSHFLKADNEYRQAIRIGQSDPETYRSSCNAWTELMQLGLGRFMPNLRERALQACGNALLIEPDSLETKALLSEIVARVSRPR